ncbi:hypothetical protein M413DRAFT_449340 [Hebeloma cylindrosporum]|uniref:Hypervirulence associated protein TUDOR domain-containing protein n=1 Tax=Hebeloma cylindrosporum TaxID=76867 RepID=A0A0C3BHU5_HEBCY|nr:hypothetical protein M413DRAFT_449340 [Hebeloma cylindrosporum h7]
MATPEFKKGDRVKIIIDWSDVNQMFVAADTIGTVQISSKSEADSLAIRYTVKFPTPSGVLIFVPEEHLELHKRAGQ